MYTYTYETRYGDYKNFDTIKISSLLDMVQDISIKDSENAGFGLNVLRERNMAWLVQGINVKLLKPVRTGVPVEVTTAVKNMKAATSERGCIIKQGGEMIGKTIFNWVAFDTEKLKPCRIPPEILEAYPLYDFGDDFFTLRKTDILTFDKADYEIRVKNKDIDTNKHLNNQKSAEILMDALPYDFEFNSLSVLYKKPAYLGDELGVCIKKTEFGFYVHLETKDKEPCVIGTFENG